MLIRDEKPVFLCEKKAIKDPNLSLEAKGLYAMMCLAEEENCELNIDEESSAARELINSKYCGVKK